MGKRHTVPTLCRMCDHGCGLDVTVSQDGPETLKGSKAHPFNKGWLCAKGRASLDLFSSPERLSTPLVRKGGALVPATWEEALGYVGERLHRLKDEYGAESLAVYHGEGIGHQEIKYYMKRFANVYGTPNFCGVGSICNASRTMAETLTLGSLTKPDIPGTRCLIVWGGNPLVSHEPAAPAEIGRLKKRGGKLVVVDPRATETAAKADVHLAVMPGRDEILILNILHVLFQEGLWDRPFTENWVNGFEEFFRTVSEERFSPEKGEPLTGVAAGMVRQVARLYGESKPASILTGNGLEHHSNGVRTGRLLAVLKALTGNLDVPGGDLFTPRPRIRDITAPLPFSSIPPVGAKEHPLFCQARKEAQALCLPEAILEGRPYPVRGMVIAGGNPTLEWPDSRKTRAALNKLEFLVVIDVVRSPDSRYADVLLPACTFLERDEHRVNVYLNLHCITLRRAVVEPVCGLPDQIIWIRLARKMGFGEYFPWKTCREGIDHLLGDVGVTYRDLLSRAGIFEYETREYKKYERDGFHTPSGRVEIYPKRLEDHGYDPSPIRGDTADLTMETQDFPLWLSTGGNLLSYTHWQYRYIPRLRKMHPEPAFEIHPDTAGQYGLAEGDRAEVRTVHGGIRLKAHLTPKIRPDTIHIPQGWEEAGANALTGGEDSDPISGFPNLKSLRCCVRKR
ncbi:MAG: molybdopterin-containing oxidoreductase family protein [Desulfatiglandales bacterium]